MERQDDYVYSPECNGLYRAYGENYMYTVL